ncbi:hypothetical protein CK203_019296 [Vitis vinifera]|uniref:Reverse transcriptase domain-containing protein n=1 Tax=Vitis vinifera TaxID=29760 RepID=A0A438J7I3_VITVI|nr:hypothetical protein CK203_019296 [Vitis vinifera]
MAFWQACWDFVKEEVVELFKEFYDQKSFAKSLNTTFLVLILKKGGAEDLGDFRPISLLGGLYKLLAKVLANRLKKVLGKVVSTDQNAFVRGRQILNASLIANEVVDYWQKWKKKGLTLRKRGMEMNVSHLLFADDTIIFCEARKEHLTHRGWILAWFEAASGLRINLAKSELILVGEVEDIEEMAVELGCRVGDFPVKYLGLPLRAHHKALSMWIWRFAFEKDLLWKKVIRVKYGQEGCGWRTNEARGGGGGLRSSSGLTIGAATQRCPKIFPSFMPWRSLERNEELLLLLRDFRISSEKDSVLWKGGGLDIFRIRDAYNLLAAPNPLVFLKKSIWVDKVPTKVAFFAWEATWEKILTLDRLQNQGWQLPNRCYLCGL